MPCTPPLVGPLPPLWRRHGQFTARPNHIYKYVVQCLVKPCHQHFDMSILWGVTSLPSSATRCFRGHVHWPFRPGALCSHPCLLRHPTLAAETRADTAHIFKYVGILFARQLTISTSFTSLFSIFASLTGKENMPPYLWFLPWETNANMPPASTHGLYASAPREVKVSEPPVPTRRRSQFTYF